MQANVANLFHGDTIPLNVDYLTCFFIHLHPLTELDQLNKILGRTGKKKIDFSNSAKRLFNLTLIDMGKDGKYKIAETKDSFECFEHSFLKVEKAIKDCNFVDGKKTYQPKILEPIQICKLFFFILHTIRQDDGIFSYQTLNSSFYDEAFEAKGSILEISTGMKFNTFKKTLSLFQEKEIVTCDIKRGSNEKMCGYVVKLCE